MSGYFMFYYVVFAVTIIWIQGIPFDQARDHGAEHDYAGDDYDSYDDEDYHDKSEDDDTGKNVTLISRPEQEIFVQHGENVDLECKVMNKKQAVIQWKDSSFPLFMDETVLHKSNRVSVHNPDDITSVLSVKNIEKDETFECNVLRKPPLTVRYHIKLAVPPKITSIKGELAVKKGDQIQLSCEATGFPAPSISWTFDTPMDTNKLKGQNFMKPNAQKHDKGKYTCIADNGFGAPVSRFVEVLVMYPPEIHFEAMEGETGEKMSAELICNVHAYPPVSKVEFTRNRKPISSSGGLHITEERHAEGSKHIIKIDDLSPTDFGEYKCIATYNDRHYEKNVFIAETPKKPDLLSVRKNENGHHIATWQTSSLFRITSYEIIYKPQENNQSSSVIKDVEGVMKGSKYSFSHVFHDLPRGTYEVYARVKNEKGWSKNSDVTMIPGDMRNEYNHGSLEASLLESVDSSAVITFQELRISLGFMIALAVGRYLV